MIPDVKIVPTLPCHVLEIRDNLQDGDNREICGFGITIAKGVWRTYKNSVMCRTALIDGEPVAFWGVAGTSIGLTGIPFLLTSVNVRKISPVRFTRIYQIEAKEMLKIYSRLENYVLADYEEAVRLLDIVGFKIGEPQKIRNAMYRKFSMGV